MATSLHSTYPWTTNPLIANAPMGGYAGSALAIAVSKSKGFGFIGATNDVAFLRTQLTEVSQAFFSQPTPPDDKTLPIGVGLLSFVPQTNDMLPLIKEFCPSVVWLFAAHELSDYASRAEKIRSLSPQTKIWVQIGSVAGALELARTCKPDAIVLQGADAGGHGWEKGASIVSLVPEAIDRLTAEGFKDILCLAAGGIVDGRGVAAALALGAHGVVMGTRFLSASETMMPHEGYRKAILNARDGGQSTIRSKVYDQLKGPNPWPVRFDGRAIVNESFTDHAQGVDIEKLRSEYAKASNEDGAGFGVDGKGRAIIWAGAGVGLVKKVQGAAEIIDEVREEAKKALDHAAASAIL